MQKTATIETTKGAIHITLFEKDAPKTGIIAFQAHAGYPSMRVEFKDIKFKDLSK